jgi:hypothetical protein
MTYSVSTFQVGVLVRIREGLSDFDKSNIKAFLPGPFRIRALDDTTGYCSTCGRWLYSQSVLEECSFGRDSEYGPFKCQESSHPLRCFLVDLDGCKLPNPINAYYLSVVTPPPKESR